MISRLYKVVGHSPNRSLYYLCHLAPQPHQYGNVGEMVSNYLQSSDHKFPIKNCTKIEKKLFLFSFGTIYKVTYLWRFSTLNWLQHWKCHHKCGLRMYLTVADDQQHERIQLIANRLCMNLVYLGYHHQPWHSPPHYYYRTGWMNEIDSNLFVRKCSLFGQLSNQNK